ncbi:hypothetical protein W97_04229 [Coniosporium apollinis CBS 100218]|uniref:Uncharacterized protein n=1 Tax=Coniosporium apollinis (strain CBS 100218) TaxID=1168221 RepID=R7YT39_CONA1|nr:uncharacterized protein W97_04229 [Coniosporium apollinis CBS 100218]EON64994.1 hypothetical protein W97_04229 [Coniosporium apollinis CBS 100218]
MAARGQVIEETTMTTRTTRRGSIPTTRRGSQSQSSPRQASDAQEADGPSSSTLDVDTQEVAAMVEGYIKGDSRTLGAKREAITKSYQNRIKQARNDINDLFSEHERRAARTRKAQLERLLELIREKGDIEKKIASSIRTLEAAYFCRVQEFQAVVRDRAKDLG